MILSGKIVRYAHFLNCHEIAITTTGITFARSELRNSIDEYKQASQEIAMDCTDVGVSKEVKRNIKYPKGLSILTVLYKRIRHLSVVN